MICPTFFRSVLFIKKKNTHREKESTHTHICTHYYIEEVESTGVITNGTTSMDVLDLEHR